jgi:hypothetical protein
MEAFIKFGIGLVAVVGLVFGYLAYNREIPVGASSGPDHLSLEFFRGGLTAGGGLPCFASSTTAAVGTLPTMNPDVTCVDYTVNVADVTLTTFASTSAWMPQLKNESKILRIRNATTTATADIILAAGTGINLKTASSTSGKLTIFGDTGADNYADIKFTRQSDSDVNAEVLLFED